MIIDFSIIDPPARLLLDVSLICDLSIKGDTLIVNGREIKCSSEDKADEIFSLIEDAKAAGI